MCKRHLSRARQWALVNGGKGGGRERREGGGEHRQVHTSANTAQQDTKQHKGRKEILHGGNRGIQRSVKAAVRIFSFRGGVEVLNIQ